jgi:hypothetical protein
MISTFDNQTVMFPMIFGIHVDLWRDQKRWQLQID